MVIFPATERHHPLTGTKLCCLVNRGTCVWTTCLEYQPSSVPAVVTGQPGPQTVVMKSWQWMWLGLAPVHYAACGCTHSAQTRHRWWSLSITRVHTKVVSQISLQNGTIPAILRVKCISHSFQKLMEWCNFVKIIYGITLVKRERLTAYHGVAQHYLCQSRPSSYPVKLPLSNG